MDLQQKQTERKPMDDETIVDLYWERDEKAIEETDFKYKKYLYSIAHNVIHNPMDCEECLNDTYLGAWNAMPPTRPNVLKAFLTTIVRILAINRYNSNARQSVVPAEKTVSLSELEDILSDGEEMDVALDAQRLGRLLSDFVRSLSERQQFIFISRYYVADPIQTIASDLGLSRSTVNKELAAIRHALKETLESEGFSI